MSKILTSLLCLLSLAAFGALPDYKAFRGSGGITVTSNPPIGTIVIDGSSISSPTGGVSAATATNIVNSIFTSSTNATGHDTITGWAFTNLLWDKTLFVDATNGNDSTALRGDMSKPWKTITNAIAAAQSGDEVWLRPGTFMCWADSPYQSGLGGLNLFSKNNIAILGAPGGLSIIASTNNMVGCQLFATNVNGLYIRDITFNGGVMTNIALYPTATYADNNWGGIQLQDCQNVVIENCRIVNHHWHGIVDHNAGVNGSFMSTNNIVIRNNYFANCGSWCTNRSLPFDGSAINPGGWTVEGNVIENCIRGIELYSYAGFVSDNCVVRNNTIRNMIHDGILIYTPTYDNVLVEGNHISWTIGYKRRDTNVLGDGLAILMGGGNNHVIRNNNILNPPWVGIGFVDPASMSNNIIENNVIRGLFSPLYASYGLYLSPGNSVAAGVVFRHWSIRNNRFDNLPGYGLTVAQMVDSEISGNTFINCGTNMQGQFSSSMFIYAGCTNLVIKGNRIDANEFSPTDYPLDAVYIHSDSKNVIMIQNDISGTIYNNRITNVLGAELKFVNQLDNMGVVRSDYTNSFTDLRVSNALYVTYGTPAAGQVLTALDPSGKVVWSNATAVAGGGLTTNANQFLGVPLSIKSAPAITNIQHWGSLELFGLGDIFFDNWPEGLLWTDVDHYVHAINDGSGVLTNGSLASGDAPQWAPLEIFIASLNGIGTNTTIWGGLSLQGPGAGGEKFFDASGTYYSMLEAPQNASNAVTRLFASTNAGIVATTNVALGTNQMFAVPYGAGYLTNDGSGRYGWKPEFGLRGLTNVGIGIEQDFDVLTFIEGHWTNYAPFFQWNIAITNIVVTTNIYISTGTNYNMEQTITFITGTNFGFVFNNNPYTNEIVNLAVYNTNAVQDIYMTNATQVGATYASGVVYDTASASNSHYYIIRSNSLANFTFLARYTYGTNRWETKTQLEKDMTLLSGTGIKFTTNWDASTVTVEASTSAQQLLLTGLTNVQSLGAGMGLVGETPTLNQTAFFASITNTDGSVTITRVENLITINAKEFAFKTNHTTAVPSAGTAETNLTYYTVPANTLTVNGDALIIRASGSFAANGNNKQIKLYFGADAIMDTGTIAINGGDWVITAEVSKLANGEQIANATFSSSRITLDSSAQVTACDATLSGAVTVKCTGTSAGADADITQKTLSVYKIQGL